MSKKDAGKVLSAAARILLAWVFVFSQAAWAAQTQNPKQNPEPARKANVQQALAKESASKSVKTDTEATESAAKQNRAEESASGDGSHEGIKVHGHWTIEVRNPDGALVTHREFENSLRPPGGAALSSILGRTSSPGFWAVVLYGSFGSGGSQPCVSATTAVPLGCGAVESASGHGNPPEGLFPTLQVSAPTAGANAGQLVLTGTITAQASAGIVFVETQNVPCSPNVAPATPCQNGNISVVTDATIPSIAVSAGQTVAVTVVVSFS